jgi:hypothetical protein
MPTGWGRQNISGSTNWYTNYSSYSVAPHNNSIRLIYMDSGNNGGQARLYNTTGIDLTKYNKVTLNFWIYRDPVQESLQDRIQVQVKRGSTWENAGDPVYRYASSYGWRQISVDLSEFGGDSIQLGFLGIAEGGNDLRIDDVSVSATWEDAADTPDETEDPVQTDDTADPPADTDNTDNSDPTAETDSTSDSSGGGGGCSTGGLPLSAVFLAVPLVLMGIKKFFR